MNAAERLDQWAALADAATPGPWGHHAYTHGLPSDGPTHVCVFDTEDVPVAELDYSSWGVRDAAFIAASRTAVPALVAALRAVLAHAERHIAIADGHDHHRPCEAKARRAFARVLIAEINAALGVTS